MNRRLSPTTARQDYGYCEKEGEAGFHGVGVRAKLELGVPGDYFSQSGNLPSPVGWPFRSQDRLKVAMRQPL